MPRCLSATVNDGNLSPPGLEVSEDVEPTLLALALAPLAGRYDFVPGGERADDREQSPLAIFDTRLHVQAI